MMSGEGMWLFKLYVCWRRRRRRRIWRRRRYLAVPRRARRPTTCSSCRTSGSSRSGQTSTCRYEHARSGGRSCPRDGHVRGTVMSGGRSCPGEGEFVNIQCVEYRKLYCWNYQSYSLCEISLGRRSRNVKQDNISAFYINAEGHLRKI